MTFGKGRIDMATIIGTANPDILTGTNLADLITGLDSDDVVYGFDGNDSLAGATGDDILYGGSGNETMDGGAGEDLIYGQSGLDTVTYASSLAGLTLNLTDASQSTDDAAGDFFLSVERFVLSDFNDAFFGAATAEDVRGGSGNDVLFGFGGIDTLSGGVGDDTLGGGAGADSLLGGTGVDLASYSDAAAAVIIDLGAPEFTTGDAQGDSYASIEGIILTGFDDILRLAGSTIHRGNGDAGNDSLFGGTGADSLSGGADDDSLSGGFGVDVLDGGDGNDRLLGGAGADSFIGGAGEDAAVYLNTVRVNLINTANGAGEGKGDTFTGIEGLLFLGTGSTYVGGSTSLTVALLGTSMTCIAGTAAEHFQSSGGAMSVSYLTTASAITMTGLGSTLFGSRAAVGDELLGVGSLTLTNFADTLDMSDFSSVALKTVLAGNGNDTLVLNSGLGFFVNAGGGRDHLTGSVSDGTVVGGTGADTIELSISVGATVSGGEGNDTITCSGADTRASELFGGAGDDLIVMSAFGGTVDGGTGNDNLRYIMFLSGAGGSAAVGGDGNDTLTVESQDIGSTLPGNIAFFVGGAGNDTLIDLTLSTFVFSEFRFQSGWGVDSLSGFDDVVDRIVFSGTAVSGLDSFDDLVITGDASETVVSFGADSMIINGLNVANFTTDDVLFV